MSSMIWSRETDEPARLAWVNQQRQAALQEARERERAAERADHEGRHAAAQIERLKAAALRQTAERLQ